MHKKLYNLRSVNTSDCEMIHAWRNRGSQEICIETLRSVKEHKEWFYSMLPNKDSEWHVLSVNKLECAIIYFKGSRGNSCSLGFYPSGKAPLGVGLIIELAGLTYAFETLKVHRVECEVVSGNYHNQSA